MSIEAMELALEALKFVNQTGDTQTFDMCYADKAITAIEETLAKPEQEPVAVVNGVYGGRFTYAPIKASVILPVGMALYTRPQPLTSRNDVLEEVAKEFDRMTSLGDTAASFACYVRGMKG